jgi:hypothetical protein
VIAIRRKTREQQRHQRAVVLQELGTPPATAVQKDIEANKRKAAALRAHAQRDHLCECVGLAKPSPDCWWHGKR